MAALSAPERCLGNGSGVGRAEQCFLAQERWRLPLTRSLRLLCRSGGSLAINPWQLFRKSVPLLNAAPRNVTGSCCRLGFCTLRHV